MGKYIKYFNTAAEFAEYWNFGYMEPGPDDSVETMVAFVNENDAVYYYDSDLSEFDVNFSAQSSEIDATAKTVTFDIKTGLFYLDVYHNGELVDEYSPGEDTTEDYSFDANLSPLTVTENFVGKWYRDNDGEKGDYITEFEQPITHLPNPEADPVQLQCFVDFDSDGQTPTRLGNGSLTGATRVYYEDNGSEIDILNDIYIQSNRAWYQFSAQGEYEVCFEFESENQVVGDYFVYSQGTYLDVFTNYPELAAQTNFRFNGPLMQSTIEELSFGEGMQYVNGFLMANNLHYIYLEDNNRLPEISTLIGVANEGAIFCDEDAENFSMWQAAKPAGWYINSTGLGAWFGSSSTFPSSGGTDHIYFDFGLPINDHFELTIDSGNAHFNNQSGPTTVSGDTNSLSTGVTFYTEVNTGETYQGMISVVAYDADGNERDRISLPYTVEGEVVPPAPTGDTVTAVCHFTYEKGGNPHQRVSGRSGWDSVYINGDPSNQLPDDTYDVDWSDYGIGDFTITYERTGDDLILQAWLQNSDMVRCEISGTTSWGMWGSEQEPWQSNTFSGCTALTEVTLDANCVKVGDNSFTDCSAIEHIYCYAATAPTISGGNQFTTLPSHYGNVYVPSGANYSTWATALGVNWGISDILQ